MARIIPQDYLISLGGIRAYEHPESIFSAYCICRIGEQNHCVIDFVQGSPISVHHIGAAFHRYREKTAVIERCRRRDTLFFRVQDTVGFRRADDMAALLSACVKDKGLVYQLSINRCHNLHTPFSLVFCGRSHSHYNTWGYTFYANQELKINVAKAAAIRPKICRSRPVVERTMEAVWIFVRWFNQLKKHSIG